MSGPDQQIFPKLLIVFISWSDNTIFVVNCTYLQEHYHKISSEWKLSAINNAKGTKTKLK